METNSNGSSLSPTKANDGASSSLTGSSYEVFLSFRGPDTRHGFTDHLYKGLVDAGIDAFKDDDELRHGEDIRPVLMKAIKSSKILIPILSETYGTSSWCLDELVQMMEGKKNNKQIVLPIFYKVKPAEVRYQKGRFGKAFHERESHLLERSSFNPTTLEKWKSALDEVSTLRGYEADGSEVQLVKSIVREVLNELKKKFELDISKNLVGIDVHVKKVMEFVDNKSRDTLFVGIHGMGGIGKTTLAKAIYNKIFNQFEHRSYIADIRESWKHNGIHYIQNQLIYDILKLKNEVGNEDEGTKFISSRFKSKKVLILLDDVDNIVQVQRLAGNHDWFSSGSRIIITTRNKGVLKESRVDHNYEHEVMDYDQSLILFSKHAFRKDSPPSEFEDLTCEVVSTTGGLPLSLEVFGSLLCGKNSTQWINTIKKLKRVPHTEVQKKLKISYEALDYAQKQIFLDIACFFIGTDKRIASYMWDACDFFPGEGIEALIFMSLIKVGNDHELIMHDHLRDLGREIVRQENQREPRYRSRLWDYEEAQKVLKEAKGTDKIEGINLSKGNPEGYGFGEIAKQDGHIYTTKQLKNLTKLRFLLLDGAHINGDFKDSIKEVKWLRSPNCPMDFEVKNFHVEELAVLELQRSRIYEKWEGWSYLMMAEKLKCLDLSYCALKSTAFLSAFKKLEVLILNKCEKLERIDASIADIKTLLRLELGFCKNLKELPTEIGKLKALQELNLTWTESLSALPNSIDRIKELPEGIERLRKLRKLKASYCCDLKRIMAKSLCNLSSLQFLTFFRCNELQSVPDLPFNLTDLAITCKSQLPSLSHLAHLKRLDLFKCQFECMPMLPSMLLKNSECSQSTDVEESESPQSLNTPCKLEILKLMQCGPIETLDVSQFIHLRKLYIGYCNNLFEVRGLDKLIYLESLSVEDFDSIERLNLPKFERLKKLKTFGCKKLVEIHGLDELKSLESLDISFCNSIGTLLLPKFGSLKKLRAGSCENLAEIQGLDGLGFLGKLYITRSTSIEKVDLPKFGRLMELTTEGCESLAEIQGLDLLEFLESLVISECTSIRRLLLPKSSRLKELEARGCKNLVEIQGLNRSEFLESLDISKCTSIGRLLLPKSGRLKELNAYSCKKLAKIQGLDRLEFLEKLDISRCTSIETLLLPKSKSLEILKAKECAKLVEIQGLDSLEFLKELNIIGCKSLQTIPELSRTQIYRYYEIADKEMVEYVWDYMDDSDESI
ncbi:hypothetical protein EUGRSUZ_C00020 [Eucalyptus grandis]|uniref:Uncharacterized protein n=1 Tax=Eucalyptus grandis TaxID=71139 RepID=A0ACC3LA41_EUCGR|nr:hypothetical protein EUGRSUZ_C00020 [Eucalyptus grandis]